MRAFSEQELERLQILTDKSVEFTLIEPTATGLGKSIMDATGSVRSYLRDQSVHNYALQQQGPLHKIMIKAQLVNQSLLIPSEASLYRPTTKKGDPRIWFTGLNQYANAGDILAIIVYEGTLFVANITQLDIKGLLNGASNNPLKELIETISAKASATALELLGLLRQIAAKGPVPALVQADTAVGRTLESLLGISINSSKQPDYKGIEIKSYRSKVQANRKNLFAQVPDWSMSKFKSSAEILTHFGYQRGTDFRLYCTVSASAPNTQGLTLRTDSDLQHLIESSNQATIGDFVVWELAKLHARLKEKHNETFWIGAQSIDINGLEHFQYTSVEHTRKPNVTQFDNLLDQGIITLDHLIKKKPNGSVVEKGPIFKIKPQYMNLLFPPSIHYNLLKP